MRLAVSKCNSQADAEDLVGDTMLAAFAYIHNGGIIDYPKTWLSNTLHHKHNDNLRKKYRSPVTVCFDDGLDIMEGEDDDYLTSEEASKVRKELNHLAHITRDVLICFYFGNQSVAEIAKGLGIPEGTVKSRLSADSFSLRGINFSSSPGRYRLSCGGLFLLQICANKPVCELACLHMSSIFADLLLAYIFVFVVCILTSVQTCDILSQIF